MSSAFHIAIVGPDGAGKSTMANLLAEHLEEAGRKVERLEPRPTWFHTVSPSTFDYHEPHAEEPRTPAKSLAQLIQKLFFYVVRTATSRKRDTVYIEERGWLDQAVDHRRYRLNERIVPVVERTARVAGRPDLIVVLGGDPAVIAARKHELEEHEVDRQLRRWDEHAGSSPSGETMVLDTTATSVEDTALEIREAVLGKL